MNWDFEGSPCSDLYIFYKQLTWFANIICCLEMSKQITVMVPSCCVLFLHLFIHKHLNNSPVEMEDGGRQGDISKRHV